MSTNNIGFYEEISKIITYLSSNILKYALIVSPVQQFVDASSSVQLCSLA